MSVEFIKKVDFVLNCLQIKKLIELIEPIKQYWKHWPIKTNQPSNWGQLISEANINSASSNWKQLFGKAKSACEQIIENDGLARLTTLAKAETNQKAIDQTITITANIADGVRWGPELARNQY